MLFGDDVKQVLRKLCSSDDVSGGRSVMMSARLSVYYAGCLVGLPGGSLQNTRHWQC